jgi:predicted RNA-binding Zn ribbon-like protein
MVSSPSERIPHSLELVVDFVNTLDPDEHTDALATPEGLAGWLAERQLLDPAAPAPGEIERRQAVSLREALRALMLEHNGGRHDESAVAELERVACAGELGLHFGAGGAARLRPAVAGAAGALAALLVPIAEASRDGTWQRVKACRDGDCLWAFYDRSRNRSGVWCDMAVCGNRAKVRAYRRRQPGAATPEDPPAAPRTRDPEA